MWQVINQSIFIAELLLIFVGMPFVFRKKNAVKTAAFLGIVLVLNLAIYLLPAFFEKLVLGETRSIFLYLLDGISAAIKAFVGDVETGIVERYAEQFPGYGLVYGLGTLIAVVVTSFAAISAFGRRISNAFQLVLAVNRDTCDFITGNSEEAITYAQTQKNTILLLPEDTEKAEVEECIESGCVVMCRKPTKAFFTGRWFNTKTRYNLILLQDDMLDEVLAYLATEQKTKQIHFYLEAESGVLGTLKHRIDAMGSVYCTRITLFSRSELFARVFVDENPYTKYLPREFFNEDTSLKDRVNLNLFLLGYGELSREIYKQFIICNQFAVRKDGEYRALPIHCSVYDSAADENAWELCGLPNAMSLLRENQAEYFALPDLPYQVDCVKESGFEFNTVREIATAAMRENNFSYIIVDTGDLYQNIKIAERLLLLLDKCDRYHLFVRNRSVSFAHERVTSYGDLNSVFTHDIIAGEALVGLARDVNRFYSGEDTWASLSYFGMASNLSLAQNLRFKLNLLGLDYQKDEKAEGQPLIEAFRAQFGQPLTYDACLGQGTRAAMLAQEHFRWNAFHLLAGYLPMKKCRIRVWEENGSIKKAIKDDALKKHGCLTSFSGLDELSNYLSVRANEIVRSEIYTAKDFDYYRYDDLLLRAIPDFLEDNHCSVTDIKKR